MQTIATTTTYLLPLLLLKMSDYHFLPTNMELFFTNIFTSLFPLVLILDYAPKTLKSLLYFKFWFLDEFLPSISVFPRLFFYLNILKLLLLYAIEALRFMVEPSKILKVLIWKEAFERFFNEVPSLLNCSYRSFRRFNMFSTAYPNNS